MKLKTWMEQSGITRQAVADAIGLHRISVYRLELGENFPEWGTVHAIRELTGGLVTEADWYAAWKDKKCKRKR